ncbi:hypothetical protein KO481_28250 [Nocardia sp. NEAU-G5]|uniref:Uncharacterized protein n=1 Tax=Nocardia albiluteola TaxID=2842303 RepID=A0ABS6B522_9NOCA|nr:hypothetical protein [Nocardia albiluteola]MBU3065407.1 hypothetical protein [Nocardia albiluteola]
MSDPQRPDSAQNDFPDVGFNLGYRAAPAADTAKPPLGPQATTEEQPSEPQASAAQAAEEQASDLAHRIARELAVAGPEGWQWLEAAFSLTVAGGVAHVLYYDDTDQVARAEPSAEVGELVRLHREISAQLGDGPWWRMTIELEITGEVEVDFDYGDEPFPDDQLLTPEAYRADLEAFPREKIPVWLAAYVRHDEQQWRSPQEAAAQARADRDAGITSELSRVDFPPLPVLWARWATIAAAFVAVGSELGPRIRPALGIFEGSARSGSTLFVLPGGRAVLSGGMWNAPELDAAYNGGHELPDLYAGAPNWVANQVLNPRAAQGMLSFCYWWAHGSWHRGDSPGADLISAAVPGVWSAQTVADIVCGVAGGDPTEQQRQAAATLVAAAEAGVVIRDTLTAVFDDLIDDIDGALYQLSLAGLTAAAPEPLPQHQAIMLVREYILGLSLDTTGYPLDQLVAERLEVGWMVFVPTEPGEIAIGRAIFYIADDGVIEQSSSSTAPSLYFAGFEQRFRQRQTRAYADSVI